MPVPLLHALQRVGQRGDARKARLRRLQAQVHRAQDAEQRQAGVGRRAAVRRARRRLRLHVVRRQGVVLCRNKVDIILPCLPRAAQQVAPLLRAQGRRRRGGQAEQPGAQRGEQPEQPRGLGDHAGGEGQQQHPQQRREGQGAKALQRPVSPPVAVPGGLPPEQPAAAYPHAPEGAQRRAAAGRRLGGEEQQTQQRPHQRAAHAGEHRAAKAHAALRVPLQQRLRPGEHQLARRAERRRGGSQTDAGGRRAEKAHGERGQRANRHQRAPRRVQQRPLLALRQPAPQAAQPGEVLPVAARPALLTAQVGEHAAGEAVQHLHVADEAAAQKGRLHRVVGEGQVFRDARIEAGEVGVHIEDALAGKAAAAEIVHAQLAAGAAVGVRAARPGKDAGEVRAHGGGEGRSHARGEDAPARRDRAPRRVHRRAGERVQHRADQLLRRAGAHARVAVQRQQKAHVPQRRVVPGGDAHAALPAPQQPHGLQQRAALALPAAPDALGAARSGPRQQQKTAAAARVQRIDRRFRRTQRAFRRLRQGGRAAFRQVRQQREQQVFPRVPVQQPRFLQRPGQRRDVLRVREQRAYHAERPSLRRHPAGQRQPRHMRRRRHAQKREVDRLLHQLGYRDQQQRRRRGTPHGKGGQKREKQRQKHVRGDIARPAALFRRIAQRRAQEPPAHVLLCAAPALGQREYPPRRHVLRDAAPPRQLGERAAVIGPAALRHPGIYARRVGQQRLFNGVRGLDEPLQVPAAQLAQRADQPGGLRLRIGLAALGQIAVKRFQGPQQRRGQPGGKQRQLLALQDQHALKAAEKARDARILQRPAPRGDERRAERLQHGAARAAAQVLRRRQRARRGQPLPPQQPAVVQQPARRAGHGGHVRPFQRQRVVGVVQRPQRPPQRRRGPPAAAYSRHPDAPGEVFRVGRDLRRLNDQSALVIFHRCPLRSRLIAAFILPDSFSRGSRIIPRGSV